MAYTRSSITISFLILHTSLVAMECVLLLSYLIGVGKVVVVQGSIGVMKGVRLGICVTILVVSELEEY